MDITILSLRQTTKNNHPKHLVGAKNNIYIPAIESFENEIRQYNISANILEVDIDSLPRKVDSNIVIIIDNGFYVKDDYLNKIISLNNLLRDGGLFCGPTDTFSSSNISDGINKINKSYQKYNLNFGSSVVSDITDEPHNYPNVVCCAITGLAYNDFSYKPIVSPRHIDISNKLFISQLAQKYKIYYSNHIEKVKYLDISDFSLDHISQFYYDTGYQDGLLVNWKNNKDKRYELWHRFVESPEILDNEMPRWLLDSNPKEDGEYLENLVICKCKYQIGFYEGMMSRKLI